MPSVSTTKIAISVGRFIVKLLGLYALIYFNHPASQIVFYTLLVILAEGYEIGAIVLSNRKPQLTNLVYAVTAALNSLVLTVIIFNTGLEHTSIILLGFLVVLASAIPGGFWAGATAGVSTSLFYVIFGRLHGISHQDVATIPFLLLGGVLFGIVSEQRALAVRQKDELLEKTTRQKTVNKLKNEFVAIASHNLRTPISSLNAALELTLSHKDLSHIELTKLLGSMQTSVVRLNKLTDDLLNIAALEDEEYRLTTAQTDILAVASDTAHSMTLSANEKKVSVNINQPEKTLPHLDVDREKMTEVFTNLISNAIKFSNEGSKIDISARQDGSQVIVSVQDYGVGIAPEEQKDLFQKFHRATDTLTYDYEGTGLGLYIAKLIVEAHGGKIWFESAIGKGTTFYFSIPLATVDKLVQGL